MRDDGPAAPGMPRQDHQERCSFLRRGPVHGWLQSSRRLRPHARGSLRAPRSALQDHLGPTPRPADTPRLQRRAAHARPARQLGCAVATPCSALSPSNTADQLRASNTLNARRLSPCSTRLVLEGATRDLSLQHGRRPDSFVSCIRLLDRLVGARRVPAASSGSSARSGLCRRPSAAAAPNSSSTLEQRRRTRTARSTDASRTALLALFIISTPAPGAAPDADHDAVYPVGR